MTEVVVEIGNTHEGSLGIATSLVDMAESAGAKTVKFQMHFAEFESSTDEPFRAKFSMQDDSRFDYWKRVNFSSEDWLKLIRYVESKGLEFLCTPFSLQAAEWLQEKQAVKRWKIGSGDATNYSMIDFMIGTHLPLIISTGLIDDQEIKNLKSRLEKKGAWERTTLLHCISKYPVYSEETALHQLIELSELGCKVGYSDHSGEIYAPILSMCLGATIVEVHVTPTKDFFGPDVKSSLIPTQIAEVVRFAKFLDAIKMDKRTKNELYEEVRGTAEIFRKGLYWRNSLKKGHLVTHSDLLQLKPLSSIRSEEIDQVVGKFVIQDVSARQPLDWVQIAPQEISEEL